MQEFFEQNSQYILIAGLLLVTTAMMMRISKRKRKIADRQSVEPDQIRQRNRELAGTRGQLEDLMVEIEQMAKRLGAQLDVKAIRMEQLLDEAERQIALLEQLNASARSQTGRALHNPPAPQPPAPADIDSDAGQIANAPGQSRPAANGLSTDDPLAKSVYELADAGMDPIGIARQLNEHVGKVELIIALRNS